MKWRVFGDGVSGVEAYRKFVSEAEEERVTIINTIGNMDGSGMGTWGRWFILLICSAMVTDVRIKDIMSCGIWHQDLWGKSCHLWII